MKTTHTPGPWYYRRLDEWTHSVVTNHGHLPDGGLNEWNVCSINKNREPEHEANARLIAAAPDLLEALKEIRPYLAAGEAILADAAITKATGGTP